MWYLGINIFTLQLVCPVKKCISICFLFIILVSQYGHYCLYAIEEMQLKEQFKARLLSRLPDSSFEIIADNGDIEWKEEGKEFFLDGELYDIIKAKKISGKQYYYVLNDHLEKKLVDEFNNILKSNEHNSKNGKLSLKLQVPVFTLIPDVMINETGKVEKRKFFIYSSGIFSLPKSIIPNPPRDIIS
jgi:hypothetical protein